ncbi:hypothetical protein [Devosia salina]|uniref:Uncharacterized protein n=1 Tax=Devosia salina TaxID=2860336 RepID=A0ABX8WEM5_9HYPH|nr:hypothetical protein [Devosia salina]QYO75172.1 hypothetical protein K1X15_10910 [Devosia salina]
MAKKNRSANTTLFMVGAGTPAWLWACWNWRSVLRVTDPDGRLRTRQASWRKP